MAMLNTADILETINMIREENLDIRTVTMGISLLDCGSADTDSLCNRIYDKITRRAQNLVPVCEKIEKEYGIPIINKRISVTPVSLIGGDVSASDYVKIARTLDRAAKESGSLPQKSMQQGSSPATTKNFRTSRSGFSAARCIMQCQCPKSSIAEDFGSAPAATISRTSESEAVASWR